MHVVSVEFEKQAVLADIFHYIILQYLTFFSLFCSHNLCSFISQRFYFHMEKKNTKKPSKCLSATVAVVDHSQQLLNSVCEHGLLSLQ